MRKQLFLGAIALSMMVGCAKEVPVEVAPPGPITLTADEAKFLAQADGNTKLPQQEIDRIIADAANFLGETSPTRSGSGRTVASIEPLKMALRTTRGGETTEEDMFYVVNFANDEGYSVIAADERIADEIALFVGSGNLDVENVENPGLAIALSRLDDYAERSIEKYEAWQDSMAMAMAMTPPLTDDYELIDSVFSYGPWEINGAETIPPMIPVEWGQGAPFNKRVEAEEGLGFAAGCVAIATAQLMTYWRHPTSYHNLILAPTVWDNIDNWSGAGWNRPGKYKTWSGPMSDDDAPKETVANLIWNIGEDVNMNWGPSSSAYSRDAINLLKQYGYSASSKQSYSYFPAKSSLTSGRPVFMEGFRDGGVGHAWLIDGYLQQTSEVTITEYWQLRDVNGNDGSETGYPPLPIVTTRVVTQTSEFFHNNWGWDGSDNGYFAAGVFNTSSIVFPSNTRANYQYDLSMWTNVCK